MYDNDEDSIEFISEVNQKVSSIIPRILVFARTDNPQSNVVRPIVEIASSLRINMYKEISFSDKRSIHDTINSMIMLVAVEPHKGLASEVNTQLQDVLKNESNFVANNALLLKVGAGALAGISIVGVLWYFMKRKQM
jgi:hypothetical protein